MMRRVLLAGAAIAGLSAASLPRAASAQPVSGPYISLGGGINYLQDERVRAGSNPATGSKLNWDVGPAGLGAVGYGFGNGFRVELEGNWRQNNINSFSPPGGEVLSGGKQQNYGAMVNGIFDMDIGANWIYPYLGVGAGYSWSKWEDIAGASPGNPIQGPYSFAASGTEGRFAYQALFGLAIPVEYLPGLSLTAEYRFFSVVGDSSYPGAVYSSVRTGPARIGASTDYNHTGLIGLRYELFPPAPPPPPAPAASPAPTPAPEAARTYLVFFDWDRADLSTRARQIVAEAATASTHVQTTRIEVNGYTDLSGTAAYNQQLSVRRAKSVETELVKDGVAQSEIEIHGYGESNPLVPTAKGVREPQNRRVEIILH
jgi:outer membrane protein OmpA-like peptidoglycan-associated protein